MSEVIKNFQFPLLGSFEGGEHEHKRHRNSFNSLYWVQGGDVLNVKPCEETLSIPFMGFN